MPAAGPSPGLGRQEHSSLSLLPSATRPQALGPHSSLPRPARRVLPSHCSEDTATCPPLLAALTANLHGLLDLEILIPPDMSISDRETCPAFRHLLPLQVLQAVSLLQFLYTYALWKNHEKISKKTPATSFTKWHLSPA